MPLCTLLRVYIFIPLAAPDTMIVACAVYVHSRCTYCLFTYNIRTCIWEEVVLCVCVCSEMMFSFIVPGGLITGKHCLVSPSCFIASGAPEVLCAGAAVLWSGSVPLYSAVINVHVSSFLSSDQSWSVSVLPMNKHVVRKCQYIEN